MSVFEDPPKRDTQLRIMTTKEEKRSLDAAAEELEVTVAHLVRSAVNEYVGRFADPAVAEHALTQATRSARDSCAPKGSTLVLGEGAGEGPLGAGGTMCHVTTHDDRRPGA